MLGKLLKAAAICSCGFAGAASAQVYGAPGPLANAAPGVIRVTVSVAPQQYAPVPPNTSDEETRKLADAALRQIYEKSLSECAVLSQVYKAQCKLVGVNANVSSMNQGVGGMVLASSASATYDLTPNPELR